MIARHYWQKALLSKREGERATLGSQGDSSRDQKSKPEHACTRTSSQSGGLNVHDNIAHSTTSHDKLIY